MGAFCKHLETLYYARCEVGNSQQIQCKLQNQTCLSNCDSCPSYASRAFWQAHPQTLMDRNDSYTAQTNASINAHQGNLVIQSRDAIPNVTPGIRSATAQPCAPCGKSVRTLPHTH